ncbi:MAG: Gfo/Idh/MocA family oxidoreductase [Planctomycetes bacterium]|nr:Gfo/Idh/MocA family oxidoreductase [Planctomycetota bacterium]
MLTPSRRQFLSSLSAAGAAAGSFWVGSPLRAREANRRARERNLAAGKLNVAIIGCGGKGESDAWAMRDENVVAICDVDWQRGAKTAERFPKARRYDDYRVLFEREPWLDAVTVSTPDHTHAVAALMAMDRGLHVFCQKPLTHSVEEARLLRLMARKKGVVTQMGNQGTAMEGVRRAAELVRGGVIGNVTQVHVWTDRPVGYWKQGLTAPTEIAPIPAHFRWDLWLGPRAHRPYHPSYAHFIWRGWWDFGTGAFGDMACHTMNMAYMAADLGQPTRIEAEQEGCTADSGPVWSKVRYTFPSRGPRGEVLLTWYDGGALPPADLFPESALKDGKVHPYGSLIIGTEGALYSPEHYGAQFQLWPEAQFDAEANSFRGKALPAPSLPRSPGIHEEWLLACKDAGPKPMSSFDYAGPLTEAILLGNVAIRAGEALEWDTGAMRVTNVDAANEFVRDEYAYGFDLGV